MNTQLQEENKRLSSYFFYFSLLCSLFDQMEQQWTKEYEAHHHFEEVCNQLLEYFSLYYY